MVPENMDPTKLINKLIEATTDALFNLPALLTMQEWSKKAPSFLYRFEYLGSKSGGLNFLPNLPLVNKAKSDNKVSHGDELGYLFDACDIFGNPINESKVLCKFLKLFNNFIHSLTSLQLETKDDLAVRDSFTKMISEFAAMTDDQPPKEDGGIFQMFSPKDNSFIKIDREISVDKDFRFCELSLWGAKLDALKTTTCKMLTDNVLNVNDLTGSLGGVLSPVQPSSQLRLNKPTVRKQSAGGILGGLG